MLRLSCRGSFCMYILFLLHIIVCVVYLDNVNIFVDVHAVVAH